MTDTPNLSEIKARLAIGMSAYFSHSDIYTDACELAQANESAAAKERERIISILEGMREKAAPKLLGSDTHWRTKERIDALSKAIEAIRDE
jgi:hypothetical protein